MFANVLFLTGHMVPKLYPVHSIPLPRPGEVNMFKLILRTTPGSKYGYRIFIKGTEPVQEVKAKESSLIEI